MWDTAYAYTVLVLIGILMVWLLVAVVIAAFQDHRDRKRRKFERKHKPYGFDPHN